MKQTMRLVDLNDDRHTYYDDNGEYELWIIDPDVPAVDAIPVEYILKQIVKLERSKGQSYHAICYRHLIEVWEMGNERKKE